jgi:hypothetical protein
MAANTLAPIDIELNGKKSELAKLRHQIQTLSANFNTMPPKERARNISEIQKAIEGFQRFFDKIKTLNIQNTGTRFAADTLKQSFFSVQGQWRKFELSLNSTRAS